MAKSETAQIEQLDDRIKSLDKNLTKLNSDVDAFNEKLSKSDASAIEGLKKEYEQLKKQYDDFSRKQGRFIDDVSDKLDGISRSRRNDAKILEYQNKLLEAQKRLLSGDIHQGTESLLGKLNSVDFSGILNKVNASPDTAVNLVNSNNTKEAKKLLETKKETEEQEEKNTENTKKTGDELKKVEMTAERLKNALMAAFGINQIRKFASEMIKVRGEFEMSEIALGHIIGNSEKTQSIWKKTMNLAVNSPLTAMQLTRATKQLAAFRVETDRLYDTTKMLADVSVGLGVDMERLILAYGHTKSSGFLRGMYARQFATAGVNIYGELADYYTKMEGHLVTFRDVYERISKKLVSFADVEKVFEKITSEGGTFYNMQQVLTDTVQGQINKIKDSWQQALNDIGKSTQGTIRGLTDIVLGLVKNWRIWLSVIEGVGVALVAFKTANIARALLDVSYAANTASKSTARLASGLKSLFSATKGNLPSTLTAIAASIVTVLVSLHKHMNDFNKEIDEQSITLYEAQQKMYDYQKRVEANNEVIKDSASNSELLKAAREDNLDVLLKLQQEYPELYDGVTQQANGEVELTKKIEAHNESLREQIRLNEKLKQNSIIDDPFEKDTQQYFEQLEKWRKRILSTQKDLKLRLLRNELNADEVPMAEAIIGIDTNDILVAIQQYNEILSGARQIIAQNKEELANAYRDAINELKEHVGTAEQINQLRFRLEESNLQREAAEKAGLADLTKYTPINTDVHAVREFGRESAKMVKEMLDGFELMVRGIDTEQKKIAENYENNFVDYFINNKDVLLNMVTSNELDVNETIRTFLEAHGQALTDENKKVWNILLNEALIGKHQMEDILKLSEISWIAESPFYQRLFKKASERLSKEGYYDFFAAYRSPTKGGDDDDKNKTYKSLDELLNLLKTMNGEYNKLSKSAYGFAKSQETVMNVFRESFKDIFKTTSGLNKLDEVLTMINFDTLDITSKQGLANAFQDLYDFLEKNSLWGQFGKDADKLRAKLQKTIDMQEVEVGMDVQVKLREDFSRQMEEAFGNYELTLELEKLNIPKDAINGLFPDFKEETFGDLQRRMSKFYESQRDKEGKVLFDEDDLKEYKKWSDKLDAEILKSRKEKAKQYSKYLEKEYSERAKLEMQHAEDIAFVSANIKDDKQRSTIIANINKKYKEDLNELNWKSFKESSFYVDMMDDIASLPAEYTKIMLNKINEILEHPETLSPRALKEAVNARQKVIEAQISTKPLAVMVNARKEIREARKELKKDQEIDVKWLESTRRALDKQIKAEAESIAEDEDKINSLKDLQGELAAYEKLLKGVSDASEKVDMVGINKLLGIEGEEDISKLDDATIKERIKLLNDLNESEKKLYDPAKKTDEQNARLVEIEQIEKLVFALQEELKARKALESFSLSEGAKKTQKEYGGIGTSVGAGSLIAGIEEQKGAKQKKLTSWKEYRKQLKNFIDAFADFTKHHNDMIGKIKEMGNAWYDMFDALGNETDVLTDGWKEFGNTMTDVFTKTMELIPQMVAGFQSAGTSINAAMGFIGLIAEAVQLVLVAITAFAKLHDAKYEKEIERQQKRIDNLARAYERLEKSIERTLDSASYMADYNRELGNIYQQIDALHSQIDAERAKKNTDEEKIKDYEDKIQEALDKTDELKQSQMELFGGISEDNYRSAAEGFVDAWKSAFLETGDGLQGLQDHFDEFLQDWFVKQATMQGVAKYYQGVFDYINDIVEGGNIPTRQDIENALLMADAAAEKSDKLMQAYAQIFGMGGEGSLSGLAAGIQGMTEEQANILEAYWNDVRDYTASIDLNVSRIAQAILGNENVNTNPMIASLHSIDATTQNIYNLLSAAMTNDGNGKGFRNYAM